MQFIVLEPTKIAGKVRKPNEILDDELLSEKQIEQLFAANLIAGYEEKVSDQDPGSSGSACGEQGSAAGTGTGPAVTPATATPAAKTATKTAKRRA